MPAVRRLAKLMCTCRQEIASSILYTLFLNKPLLRDTTFGNDIEGYLALILSRADIADVVGTARELCIRILAKFKKDGIRATKGKHTDIRDKNGLQ